MYNLEVIALYELKDGRNFAEVMISLPPLNFPKAVTFEIENAIFNEFISGSSWELNHCGENSRTVTRIWRPIASPDEPDLFR